MGDFMKILGVCGSPREGNTLFLLKKALETCGEFGVETELVHVGQLKVAPCSACAGCKDTGNCVQMDDMTPLYDKIRGADGIILASPVYLGGVSAQMKAFMDRTRALRGKFELRNKVGAGISVGGFRNGGQETTLQQIFNFFLIHNSIIVADEITSHYGGVGHGYNVGDCNNDEYGIKTSQNTAKNLVKVIKMIKGETKEELKTW